MEAKQTVRELLDRSLSAVKSVIPAEAAIQVLSNSLRIRKMDAGLRRHDDAAFFWNARNGQTLADERVAQQLRSKLADEVSQKRAGF